MKKLLLLTITIMALISSCTKSSSSNSTNLNTTESSLVGTWYLQSKSDSSNVSGFTDTTYTGYNSSYYINLEGTRNSAAAQINSAYLDGVNIPYETTGYGITASITVANSYWYYDQTASKLIIQGINYTLVSVTSSDLIFKFSGVVNSDTISLTYHYHK